MRKLALLVAFGFLGCGSEDDGAAVARAHCETFITADVCAKIVSCDNTLTLADCVSAIRVGLDCSKVTGESASLDTCRSQLSSSTCSVLLADDGIHIPASCMSVFTK